MKKRSSGLVKKISFGFLIIVVLFVVIIGSTMIWAMNSVIKHTYMEKATMTAELLIERIDVKKFEQLAANPQENDLYFELQEQLTHLLELNPITYMYVVVPPVEGEEAMTLVDGGDLQSDDVYVLGDTMDGVYYDDIIASINEHGSYSEFENTEEFGDLISSYVPLENESGEIFAILGVDDAFVLLNTI
ncbi:MAG: hypothetical protein ABS882_08010 [Lysinibacillus sp.]